VQSALKVLGKLEGLAGLPLRKLEALRARMTVRQFSKRSIIYEEGQSERAVYVVLSGIARLICLSRKRKRNLLEVLGPGHVIEIPSLLPDIHHKPESGAIAGGRRHLTGVAVDLCRYKPLTVKATFKVGLAVASQTPF